MSLYAASVPVFLHYLGQMRAMLEKGDLAAQIADSFPAGQQFATATGFALRTSFPLVGRAIPELHGPTDVAGLTARITAAEAALRSLRAQDFDGAETRIIRHQAGQAMLEQTGRDFLYLYALPNFFFHLTMGYAALRAAGADLGKADFDGFHAYPAGFRFS
ncbi:MAG: hypothetical protein RLZZ437_1571 [Pseudomonadota bacterium]